MADEGTSPASSVADILPRKYWPFALVGLAGLGIYFWYVKKPTGAEAQSPAGTDAGVAAGGDRVPPDTGAAGDTSSGDTSSMPGKITTNQEWANAAIAYLVTLGDDAAFAQTAVTKAMEGDPLTTSEQAAMSLAILALGNPPDGIPPLNALPPGAPPHTTTPGVVTPAPGGAPAPKPPASVGKPYTVKGGDTLWSIAQHAYGSGSKWTRIYDANASTIENAAHQHGRANSGHGTYIYPNTVLRIP